MKILYWIIWAFIYLRQYVKRQFIIIIIMLLPSNTQKKNLIQAMKKLTYQISNNSQRQKQIFDSLTSNDLIKIVQNLYDDNQYLRRISALLLCELFYNNPSLKIAMAEKLCLPLSHGRICLNRIPDSSAQKTPSDVRKCLQLMKSPIKKGEDTMFCWAINLDKKHIDLEFYQFKKYSSFTFLDPQRVVFGFTLLDADRQHQTPQSPATQSLEASLKYDKRQSSQDSKLGSEIAQRKYSISKKIQSLRPATSITSREKQIYLNSASSKQKSYNIQRFGQEISSPGSGLASTANKSKLGTSIQSISQYARNSYGRQNNEKPKQKQKQRYSVSFTNEVPFQSIQMQTDRYDSKKYHMQSSANKVRSNSKTPQNHHQNFYKRVQQILRK